MTNPSYSLLVGETIYSAWQKVHGAKATIWLAVFITFIIGFGIGLIAFSLAKVMPLLGNIAFIIYGVITYLLAMGLVYIGLRRGQDLPISFEMIFQAFKPSLAFKSIAFYILLVIVLLIPMLIPVGIHSIAGDSTILRLLTALLFIAGYLVMIYLVVRFSLGLMFILDKEVGPVNAFTLSYRATRCNFWRIFVIHILLSLIYSISMIPLFIGLIWTLPLLLISYGVIYKNLSTQNMS